MLRLASETDPAWVDRALANLDTVLLDHAHCEKKAASTAMNLIFRYQRQDWLMRPLSEHAREELEHFELMLRVLDERGVPFGPLDPSPYAKKLLEAVRHGEPGRMVDTLLCLSLIEARSCERMQLLAEALGDDPLGELYRGLLTSEARHHATFVDLAIQAGSESKEQVLARLRELAAHEAQVIAETALGDVRMHS